MNIHESHRVPLDFKSNFYYYERSFRNNVEFTGLHILKTCYIEIQAKNI